MACYRRAIVKSSSGTARPPPTRRPLPRSANPLGPLQCFFHKVLITSSNSPDCLFLLNFDQLFPCYLTKRNKKRSHDRPVTTKSSRCTRDSWTQKASGNTFLFWLRSAFRPNKNALLLLLASHPIVQCQAVKLQKEQRKAMTRKRERVKDWAIKSTLPKTTFTEDKM